MQALRQRQRSRRASSFGLPSEVLSHIASSLGARRLSTVEQIPYSPLLKLPNELLLLITRYLDLPSTTSLRWTCRQLFYRVPAKKRYEMDELVAMESWPEYTTRLGYLAGVMPQLVSSLSFSQERNLFACSGCLRLRPPEYFSTSMLERGYSKSFSGDESTRHSIYRSLLQSCVSNGDEATDERLQRLCINCGITSGKYWPGSTLSFGSPMARRGSSERGVGVVCGRCGQFESIQFEKFAYGQRRKCQHCDQWNTPHARRRLQPLPISEEAIVDDDDDDQVDEYL